MERLPAPREQRWRATARVPARERSAWHWLLAIPVVLPLLTPLYNRIEPRFVGMPFFYWFQLAFIGLDVVVVTVVYQVTGRRERP
jgi:hypothetical protein